MLKDKYQSILDKQPRRTNECWLRDTKENKIYIYGYKFLMCLEGTSLEIWLMMDGQITVREIYKKLKKKYQKSNDNDIFEDIISFIIHLERSGLAAWRTRPLFEDININE